VRSTPPLLILLGLAVAVAVHSETFVWVDEEGVTHITDDPERAPPEARHAGSQRAELGKLWDGPVGPADGSFSGPASREEARTRRLVRGAVADLQRGENARAAVVLRGLLREQPSRPEPHWYLALLDRHRGRYESAGAHLEAFLASAGDDLEPWRASAERRLVELADERRLADEASAAPQGPWVETASTHFRVHYDPELGRASDGYANTVMRYLEEARKDVGERLGTYPAERMGVVFYGKASYNRAHRHRFTFQTVGFFDGRIHVVSAAHPAGELRALLYHEYVHAIYRERTGGDRPYWFNEGLAELAERESRRQMRLTRSERSLLRTRIEAGEWIPLRRLAPSFSGLSNDDARAAYWQATAATAWIEDHTDRAQRARILSRLGAGWRDDDAFRETLAFDTEGIDAAVRRWIRSEFPATAWDAKPPEGEGSAHGFLGVEATGRGDSGAPGSMGR